MTTYRINDNGIDREMTASEMVDHQKAIENARKADEERETAWKAVTAAKASARAKLAALGLTEAEVAALVG